MAGQIATVWSLIEGAPLSAERGDEPPEIPDAAIEGVRRTLDAMIGPYLIRRGKTIYCDKSLGTARFAELLLRIYPEARFLCLYRHPMDVIASGIEACPWGLTGYGFDPYAASTPGNAVWALARFWVDNVSVAMAAEEQFSKSCHRVRYEDLVADPEGTAASIFDFLNVAAIPGISERCFSGDRERFGPADYKIWHTSRITDQSVGRGWSVPAGMIPPPAMEMMNDLAQKLGYVPIDDQWGTSAAPSDLRVDKDIIPAAQRLALIAPPEQGFMGAVLETAVGELDDGFAARWHSCLTEPFGLVATASGHDGGGVKFRVDLAAREISPMPLSRDADDQETVWDIVGSPETWQAVFTQRTNLGVALRRCELRYCETHEAGPLAADTRIGMLADLIGLRPSWQQTD